MIAFKLITTLFLNEKNSREIDDKKNNDKNYYLLFALSVFIKSEQNY